MPNNTISYFKLFTILAALAVVVWLVTQFKSCTGGSGSQKDTISVKIDTVFISTHDTILLDNPIPYKVEYVREIIKHDTLETIETILQNVDSAKILAQYLATRNYDTTVNVNYGKLRVRASVTQNRVTNARFDLTQDIPQIKETITLRQPKRNVGYIGIVAIGNQNNIPYASGISLGMKIKNDAMFEVMGLLTKDEPMYGVGMKWPIRFRKK